MKKPIPSLSHLIDEATWIEQELLKYRQQRRYDEVIRLIIKVKHLLIRAAKDTDSPQPPKSVPPD